MADDLPPVPDDVIARIEELTARLKDRPEEEEVSRKLEYILDALIMRGQLPESFRRVVSKIRADRGHIVKLAIYPDKYTVENADVDCAARIPLCGARCCGFNVNLSEQDVLERKLPFVVEQPYALPRDPATKRCTCAGQDGACTVYDYRPATCRTYSCRDDRRVWIDFDARIPAPMPANLVPDPILSSDERE